MISAFVVICLFATGLAQIPQPRDCPDVGRIENFNTTRFMGKWYRAKSAELRPLVSCESANYVFENGVLYHNVEYRVRSPLKNTKVYTLGPPVQMNDKRRTQESGFRHYIMAIDYTSYAIMYICDGLGADVVEILTRERHPSEEVLRKALDILKEKVGDVILFDADQSNCEQPLQEVTTTMKPGWKTF